ncbi:MAG: SDR family oxidoreductase, partial [Acidobacteria bacterium]|nr:SDR family oxidoreductase [Acidobacteriota bacterium]
SRGMDVAVTFNRSPNEANQVAAAVRRHGRRAVTIQADLSNADACPEAVNRAAEALGRLDVLVNMASVYRPLPLADTDAAAWNATVDVDLRASFLCAAAAVPHMRRAGTGRIVNFSDWVAASGRPRYPGYLAYYVAKRGVIGLTEALALELAADQILVNAIAPGPMLAPDGTSSEEVAAVESATPLGHWGGAQPIVEAVAFLIAADFITGETIRVDGGRHVK